jgi:hypothetical protein
MARPAAKTDFPVDVEGVGTFVFGRRKLADEIKIHVEYSRLTEAVVPTAWLDQVATWMSTLKVMTVRFPDGFDIEELDPLEDETYQKLLKVHAALIAKESSFRLNKGAEGQAGGTGAIKDA